MTRRVLLLHGLWMPRASMHWLARRLAAAGFAPEPFGYSTVAGGPDRAVPELIERLRRGDADVVAHSLGGLITLTALRRDADLPVRRVVCLGSPLCGSAAAEGLSRRRWSARTLGRSAELLRRGCVPWQGRAEVGVIAGRVPFGLGQFFGGIRGDSDGTVAVAETRLPGLADHAVVAASHSGLLFSRDAAAQAAQFLREGRFAPGALPGPAGNSRPGGNERL
ncbi:esterase/lipase family protein [Lysobacter sp. D1-1-M9]|uniref:esterase/lipase family protein n=1 Tax=Novilysobacter longmucuonensis TaxID=3098603 RepID=UPI0039833F97